MGRTLACLNEIKVSSGQQSTIKDGHRSFWVVLLLGFFCFAPVNSMVAQEKYSPEDEAVQAIAKKGLDSLRETVSKGPEVLLCGLAAIEYSKRYHEPLPIDGPLVSAALKYANRSLDKDSNNLTFYAQTAIYEQAIALIVYCEVDDVRYKKEINALLGILRERQQRNGSYNYFGRDTNGAGDVSMAQYVGLSLWVAKQHGFDVDIDSGRALLDWLCDSMNEKGSWYYHSLNRATANPDDEIRNSLHCSGLSSTYLLADFLQLEGGRGGAINQVIADLGLPPSVSVHVPDDGKPKRRAGPLVSFDRGKLQKVKTIGNKWLADHWTVKSKTWNYYYLYALERYAYFREAAEQEVSEIPTWYDQGVDYLKSTQSASGSWPAGKKQVEKSNYNTAFAIMFLVRASEVLAGEAVEGTMNGNANFAIDRRLTFNKDGSVTGQSPIKGVDDVFGILAAGVDDNDLDFVLESLAPVIGQMANRTDKSHGEQLAFLRGLLSNENPRMRQIAIRLLAGQQVIENAPALIYAMSDREYDVRVEAHNGLRLISRRIDTLNLPENPTREDFEDLKRQWTEWYLNVNPGAKLLE